VAAIAKALVIGAGIGGLSAAIGLKRRGVDVELVEISKSHAVYHVGIIVQANFLAALGELGMAEKAIASGFLYNNIHNCDAAGNIVFTQPPMTLGTRYPPYLGLTRPALHRVLTETARECGIPLRLGVTFETITEIEDRPRVSFTDGSSGRYDLVVGADGLKSNVRRLLFGGEHEPQFTGQGVWRYNVNRPAEVTDLYVFRGKPGMTTGLVPLSKETMYIFVASAEPSNPRFAPGTLALEFRQRLEGYGGPMVEAREQVVDSELVVYRPMESMILPAPWYRGAVLLIGDAVHPSTPHLGQGAALAVEDAIVLADEIERKRSLQEALDAFMARRFARAATVVEGSLKLGEVEKHPELKVNVPELIGQVLGLLSQPL